MLRKCYDGSEHSVRIIGQFNEWYDLTCGFHQGSVLSLVKYCRMANFSVSIIFPFFSQMLSNRNNQHRIKQYSTCPDLINTEKSSSLPVDIYSLVY